MPAEPGEPRTRGHAFGIDLELTFAVPELPVRTAATGSPVSLLEPATASELRRSWPASATPVLTRTLPDGSLVMAVERHDDAGFQVWAPRYGRHHLSTGGARIRSALPRIAPWRWERLLFAQVLPLAAALHGRELFHASAVARDGVVLAFVGAPGAGKSSVAAHLVARGASLFTDDVLALASTTAEVIAHPGTHLAGVYRHELASMGAAGRARLGSRVGDTHKAYLASPVVDCALPLGAVYFLRRGAGKSIEITQNDSMAEELLSSSFISYLDLPRYLIQHLDMCARIAKTVPTLEVSSPSTAGAKDVAAAIETHAKTFGGTGR
jgi:hypothetical protein